MNGMDLSADYTRDDNELIKMQDFRREGHSLWRGDEMRTEGLNAVLLYTQTQQ